MDGCEIDQPFSKRCQDLFDLLPKGVQQIGIRQDEKDTERYQRHQWQRDAQPTDAPPTPLGPPRTRV